MIKKLREKAPAFTTVCILTSWAALLFMLGYGAHYYTQITLKAQDLEVPQECVSVYNYCVTVKKSNVLLEQEEERCQAQLNEINGVCE